MSATFAVAVLAVVAVEVAVGVWARVSWRGRQPTAPAPGLVPTPAPPVAAEAQSWHPLAVARVLAVAAATAGISVVGAIVLIRGLLDGSGAVAWWALASMVLVALATVVGTLGPSAQPTSGSALGLVLGCPPLWIIFWLEVSKDSDPQAPIAWFIVVLLTGGVSAAAWAVSLAASRRRRRLLGAYGDRQEVER